MILSYLYIGEFAKDLCILLKLSITEGERERRERSSIWPQWPGLRQVKAMSFILVSKVC